MRAPARSGKFRRKVGGWFHQKRLDPVLLMLLLASLGLAIADQLLSAIALGSIAVVVALWAYRRSLFGVALRKKRIVVLDVESSGLKAIPEDGNQHPYDVEIRPRIWHEKVTEVDIRFVYSESDKREDYLPVPPSVIKVNGVNFEPGSKSRQARTSCSSYPTANNTGVAVTFNPPLKLDRGRGINFRVWVTAGHPFNGYLSFRTQTDNDAAMLLTRIPIRTVPE